MHIVTLSFDDGFKKSCQQVADIYERRGLAACFNIVATAHQSDWVAPNEYQKSVPPGDFVLWNELQARGHEIMPHGLRHVNKTKVTFEEAKSLISQCFDVFDRNLRGFDRKRAVFNFPYNSTTAELEAWVPTVCRAFRGGISKHGLNPLPNGQTKVIRTTGFGPGNCEEHLDTCVNTLLAQPEGWLVYNTHGLDKEGWGPISATYLEKLLDRLIAIDSVQIKPTGVALGLTNK